MYFNEQYYRSNMYKFSITLKDFNFHNIIKKLRDGFADHVAETKSRLVKTYYYIPFAFRLQRGSQLCDGSGASLSGW